MKNAEIKIGGVYRAKVSDKLTDVRIDRTNPHGGWDGTNLATGKTIRIKSAQRLRSPSKTKAASTASAGAKDDAKSGGAQTPSKGKQAASPKDAQPKAKSASKPAQKTTTKAGGAKKAKSDKPKKPSGLDAAAQVLAEAKEPMRCKDMVETMIAKGLWSSSGKTPHATIYAAIIREIAGKGDQARFKKTDRGLFTINK